MSSNQVKKKIINQEVHVLLSKITLIQAFVRMDDYNMILSGYINKMFHLRITRTAPGLHRFSENKYKSWP